MTLKAMRRQFSFRMVAVAASAWLVAGALSANCALAVSELAHDVAVDEMAGIPLRFQSFQFMPFLAVESSPVQGLVSQANGFYSDGNLENADILPDEAFGLVKLFRERDRRWATADLRAIILGLADHMQRAFPGGERIQLGDTSARHGGLVTGHVSHQNGLDADLSFLRMNRQELNPDTAQRFEEDFVVEGRLTENFDIERNFVLFAALVETGRINRIFVDGVIKKAMCDFAERAGQFERSTEVLRRLRPYENHKNHIHLRLTCPQNSPRCVPQVEVPEGNGCDLIQQQ